MDEADPAEPAALLEREREVERIRAALRAVGRLDGGTVVVEGPAGIGKSRLLEEARQRASALGVRVFSARATELEQGFPFGIVRQLFERPLREADPSERERWLAGPAALGAEVLIGTPRAPIDPAGGAPSGDSGYASQHGLYWLASNVSADAPLVLVVDDLQWCDGPSARALGFISRRLEGQPLALVLATRPLDPTLNHEAATLVGDPDTELVRPSPLTRPATAELVAARLSADPDDRFVRACLEVTGGNPFLLGELLTEAAARGINPAASAAAHVGAIVPRGVANAVLLRLARLAPETGALARALSILGEGAQVGDAGRLAELEGADLEAAMAALVSAGVAESGGTVRFTHPVLRAAIYGDLSPAERERLHHAAASILRDRGAPAGQVAAQVMHTEPAADPGAVAVLLGAARDALALGDAASAAALLSRALDEPPTDADRPAVVLALGQARARTGAPEAIPPLTEIVEHGQDPAAIAAAAIDLSNMLSYAGRAAEGVAILRRAQDRLPADEPAREHLAAALLGVTYTSSSARMMIADLGEVDLSAPGLLQATTLARRACDEVFYLGSASTARDLAQRALATGLPLEAHGSLNYWAILVLVALAAADGLDTALRAADEILAAARRRGAALTVASTSAMRAYVALRGGDLIAAQADAQAAIDLAPDLVGAEFPLVLAVSAAVLAGLERDESPESLRRLINRTGARYDEEFLPSGSLRYASGLLRAAAGNHEAAVEELRSCELGHPGFGGENPATLPWRSAAALSLAELGRHGDARLLAAEEVRRARSFGAARALGAALRVQAVVGPATERAETLEAARAVLAPSSARLDLARVLVDMGATSRAAGRRTAARQPLEEGLELAARCGARTLERRAREELAAIGVRPRSTGRDGADSLTPSERRVVELAATGGTNREIAQTLFVTEKTVEAHLGRSFRKLNISSRRQLPEVLARAAG
jgi:DNA-binding CsgD family transcriptional regulator/tetratricopeptide (TPR) repeat protein